MADFIDVLKTYLIQICTLVVGGMVIYELYSGKAIVRGTRSITRQGNPFRYWFWALFHTAILAVLIFAWIIGIEIK